MNTCQLALMSQWGCQREGQRCVEQKGANFHQIFYNDGPDKTALRQNSELKTKTWMLPIRVWWYFFFIHVNITKCALFTLLTYHIYGIIPQVIKLILPWPSYDTCAKTVVTVFALQLLKFRTFYSSKKLIIKKFITSFSC